MIFSDGLICTLSVWLAFGLRLDQWGYFQSKAWIVLIVATGLCLPLFIIFGLYQAIFRYIGSVALVSIARAFIIYSCLFFGVFTLITVDGVPRSIGVIQPMLLFFGIAASRYFTRVLLGSAKRIYQHYDQSQQTALIYGAGSAGRQLAAGLSNNQEMLVKGFIDDNLAMQGNTINGVPVYSMSNLKDLIVKLHVTDILLAIPSAPQIRRNEIITSLYGCGVRVRSVPSLLEMTSGRISSSELHDLDMNDLLGRQVVPPDANLLKKNIFGKVVLVTGAGGSIGSELCRQILKFSPTLLVLVDNSEYALYSINEELKKLIVKKENNGSAGQLTVKLDSDQVVCSPVKLIPCLASVRDRDLMHTLFTRYQPATVFHAAAYKHVPLVEENPAEGIRNNVFGTLTCAQIARQTGVSHFILVSTDKAVRPTNVMGASKRIAELVLQAMADMAFKAGDAIQFSMVRFGNVLGSSGSVAPLFRSQIRAGGPITLTHPEVTRFFMTIPEAAQLVIQAAAMATGGDVFFLDMGQPVRIYELAAKMIYLSGLMVRDELNPQGDIEIKVTGLRPGEKLYEELLIGENPQPTSHPKIIKAHEEFLPWGDLEGELEKLNFALQDGEKEIIVSALKKLVAGYRPNAN